MSRAAFGCVVVAALAVGLAFRLARLDLRPMHHDEANQAVKFGGLLEKGDYRYDRNDHHGPTLYYLTLPAAWARGQATLASLDERTLRAVPALFGAGLILLFLPLARGLGRPAVAAAALLAACSPVLTYYSRFYIQESIFAFFALAFLIAAGRFAERPGYAPAVWAGLSAGLAYATKETSLVVLPVVVSAAWLARATTKPAEGRNPAERPVTAGRYAAYAAAGAVSALAVAFVFYSSFLRHPGGLLESTRAFGIYLNRGIETGPHTQPFAYYARLLTYFSSGGLVWTEGLVLGLACLGMIASARRTPIAATGFWPRYLGLYALLAFVAFSAIRYKTPWNVLPFYVGFVLMAGVGAAALLGGLTSRVWRGFAVVVLLAATGQLAGQCWRASFRYPADPRNPYVYAHTVPDLLRLVQRVTAVASLSAVGSAMPVYVIAGPYEQWPLPWYLRRMTRVGYWTRAGDAGRLVDAPVVIASQDQAEAVGDALGDSYVQEVYGVRPDVILTVYVERSLWDRLLAARGAR